MDKEGFAVTALRRIALVLMCLTALMVAQSPALAATSAFEISTD